ncbi:VOC family protein [Denitrificimonas sp. JX-1]|uniref:VOC family protein n=1 Tax=Denitrificimonas halotolerans TaxID=3098930 RepID=A0ABU5GQQ5_9GAMM|nr:VOC family protein [Denitrificimonas sp. JX-1]MDY7219124.1 VOC family protein [Denitrificimonas sp. JX-1]
MINYVTLGVRDIAAAKRFYCDLLAEIGAKLLIDGQRIVFIGKSMTDPMLAICVPFNQEPATPGNGNMVAFSPGSTAAVDALYKKALALGARCEGKPGERMPGIFYGAYVRDADGNKLCFNHFLKHF